MNCSTKTKKGPKQRLMEAAEQLFAEHGIDGVGVRAIAQAAGHKNANSIHYHFGTKENLVKEIVREGALKADACRERRLQQIEARGEEITVRDVIKVLLAPTVERAVSPSYTRLVNVLLMDPSDRYCMHSLSWHKDGVSDEDPMLYSVERCEEILFRLIRHIPRQVLQERLYLFNCYLLGFLVTRDMRIDFGEGQEIWFSEHILEHFIDTAEALLTADQSSDGRNSYRRFKRSTRASHHVDPELVKFDLFDPGKRK